MNYQACMSLVGADPRSVPDEGNWRAQEFIFILQMAIPIRMPKVPPKRCVYLRAAHCNENMYYISIRTRYKRPDFNRFD